MEEVVENTDADEMGFEAMGSGEWIRSGHYPMGRIRIHLSLQDKEKIGVDVGADSRRAHKGFDATTIEEGAAIFPSWKVIIATRPLLVEQFLIKITKDDVREASLTLAALLRFSKEFGQDVGVVEGQGESATAVMERFWDFGARVLIMTVFSRWFCRRVMASSRERREDVVKNKRLDWKYAMSNASNPMFIRSNKTKTMLLHGMLSAMARVAEDDMVSPFCTSTLSSAGLSTESKALLCRTDCVCDETDSGEYYMDPSMLLLPLDTTHALSDLVRHLHKKGKDGLDACQQQCCTNIVSLGIRTLFARRRIRHADRVIEGDSFGVMKRPEGIPFLLVKSMVGQVGERACIYSVLEANVKRRKARAAPPAPYASCVSMVSLMEGTVCTASRLESHTLYHCTVGCITEFCRDIWGQDAFVRSPSSQRWAFFPESIDLKDIAACREHAIAWMNRPMVTLSTSTKHASKRSRTEPFTRNQHMDAWRRTISWEKSTLA